MEIIIRIYLSINFFMSGYAFEKYLTMASNKKDARNAYLLVFSFAFFGVFFLIFLVFFVIFAKIWRYINGYFQIAFLFDFYLGNKYKNMKEKDLKNLNKFGQSKRNTNSVRDKIYKKCLSLINESNQYTYDVID